MYYHHQLDMIRIRHTYAADIVGMSAPMREAVLFLKCIENYPLHIEKEDLFAGWYGYNTAEERENMYAPIPEPPAPDPNAPAFVKQPVHWISEHGYNPGGHDRAHHISDYKTILSRGINSYIEQVKEEMKNPDNDEDKNIYLAGMLKSLEGAELLSGRFVALAEQMAAEAENDADKARLLRMAAACRKVPMNPPEDFYEAIQAAFLIRALNCMSTYTCVSVSYGNFDQYMYPYYLKSKEKGMSDDEVIALLLQLFRMLDTYDGNDCALSVGGVDENGNDATNELSYLLVKAEKQSKLRAPLFAARINKNTPKEFMRELVSKELFEMGQPSFYGEESCYNAMVHRGVDPEHAKKYQISTCMNITMADCDVSNAWGCLANTHLPLELVLNGGQPLVGEMPIDYKTKVRTEYNSVDEIFEQYRSYMTELFDFAIDWGAEHVRIHAKEFPAPWLSTLTNDCIKRGRDRWDGGPLYYIMVIEMMGFANTADAITAIDQLVFEQKKYTIADIVAAAKANYEGYEELHRDLLQCEKYGMNKKRADENARRLLNINADICEAKQNGNRYYCPSLHTLWDDVNWGKRQPAFLDGRRAGEPVNKNAGPSTLARRAGATNVALSATKLDQYRYGGGQALDVHIGIRNLDSEANRDKIAAFIHTYFDLGGLLMQVNGLSVETLQKAYDCPEDYPDLLVRIGGHSRYFKDFSNDMKLKFIERFKIEEGAFGS